MSNEDNKPVVEAETYGSPEEGEADTSMSREAAAVGAEAADASDEERVEYDHDNGKNCFFPDRKSGNIDKKKKQKLKVKNKSGRDMDFDIKLISATRGDGTTITPTPNPFEGDPTRKQSPKGNHHILNIKPNIGYGAGLQIRFDIQPVKGCPHSGGKNELAPSSHTEWIIEC